MASKKDAFKEAYKKERNPDVKIRMVAVNMVLVLGHDPKDVAKVLMQSRDWAYFWVRRYREGGLAALRDLPRSGRPPKVEQKRIAKIVGESEDGIVTPKKLRSDIHEKTGVWYHPVSVRRLMRNLKMSPKVPELVHTSRPDTETIRRWQRSTKRQISRLKRQGFATVILDESIFVDSPTVGRKYWSGIGEPITVPYRGSRRRTVAYGAISTDGRRFFRTYDSFDGPTFIGYLRDLCRHFGKILVIMDGAPAHTTRAVKNFVKDNRDAVRVKYLPVATPELSAIEEYWHQAKRDILVSEYYATFEEMKRALSEHLRTAGFDQDVMEYIGARSRI